MQSLEKLSDEIAVQGWASVSCENAELLAESMLETARAFGQPSPNRGALLEQLTPLTHHQARAQSLSAKYGLEEFPLHTDFAHWTTPARYILLGCFQQTSPVPTHLLDTRLIPLSKQQIEKLKSAVFLVRSGQNSFYTSISSFKRDLLRFDPGCMIPQDRDAEEVNHLLSYKMNSGRVVSFDWAPGRILVIDNWRTLHGRGAAGDSERMLWRTVVI